MAEPTPANKAKHGLAARLFRRFFTETVLYGGGLVRKVHPARRKADRDEFVYTSASGLTMRTPKGFIRDIYYSSVYSPDMRGPLY